MLYPKTQNTTISIFFSTFNELRKLFYISLCYFLLLAITACKKQHNITIQANDLNNGTENAFANMPFLISQARPAWFEDKVDKVYDGVLDENGFASFDLKMQKDWSYILSIKQPENICHGGLVGFYLDNEKSNVVTFSYANCGYVNLPRVNINCENENDKFRMKYYYTSNADIYKFRGYIDENDNWQSNKFQQGCIDFSNINAFNQRPAGQYTIEWQVERTSGTTNGSDVFTITENDTTNYLIEY